ncbi:MAG: hydroxyacid dehydrogenase [bacterium]|nr:hydroxyacid dehydrogenase [bacterium]
MPDVVITEFMDADAIAGLQSQFDVHYDAELAESPHRIAVLVAGARALIVRNKTSVDRGLLDAAPHLIVVGRLGVGLDNIDLEACDERGIVVLSATGANANSVAEYVIGAMFTSMRPALTGSARVLSGQWPRQDSIGFELAGKRLGLIGFGGIARLVAAKARALGLEVCATDPFVKPDDPAWKLANSADLPDLLASSDFVSLHVPLVAETRHLLDQGALALMKPTAVVINTSRGGIVDEAALAGALRSGRLGGAALDVFEDEPLGSDSQLRNAPNLIATPHIAGLTAESQRQVSHMTAQNVRRALAGGN